MVCSRGGPGAVEDGGGAALHVGACQERAGVRVLRRVVSAALLHSAASLPTSREKAKDRVRRGEALR